MIRTASRPATSSRAHPTTPKIDPLDTFKERAAMAARLWYFGEVSLLDAADDLEIVSRRIRLDVDEAQRIMSEAFQAFRNTSIKQKEVRNERAA
jgi:hypothetical protein